MPQPMLSNKDGTTPGVGFGPNIILHRKDLAAEIGNIVANWTLIEHELRSLCGLMLGDTLPFEANTDPEWIQSPRHSRFAIPLFEEVQSLNARLSLLIKLCKEHTVDDQIVLFTDRVAPLLRKASRQRNIVAHGEWGVSDAYPDALILTKRGQPNLVYKADDFKAVGDLVLSAHKALWDFNTTETKRRQKRVNTWMK